MALKSTIPDALHICFIHGVATNRGAWGFDAKEFGKRLHDVRTSRGITQEELAVRLGLASKQHVSRMENGERSCSIDLLIELSCILHVSTDYLLMGSEPSKEEVKNDLLSIISELSTIAKKI